MQYNEMQYNGHNVNTCFAIEKSMTNGGNLSIHGYLSPRRLKKNRQITVITHWYQVTNRGASNCKEITQSYEILLLTLKP